MMMIPNDLYIGPDCAGGPPTPAAVVADSPASCGDDTSCIYFGQQTTKQTTTTEYTPTARRVADGDRALHAAKADDDWWMGRPVSHCGRPLEVLARKISPGGAGGVLGQFGGREDEEVGGRKIHSTTASADVMSTSIYYSITG